ncbi:MAG: NAD(P)-dependent oxidoreductase [Firmicutes bacterium]|nr:NAD(P)-dependent oxidoreductase [Bacillota bacterium]
MKPRVGFIGLGVIGAPMAGRLLDQGLPLLVWNRTPSRADSLVARGAHRAASPCELAAAADLVITMVTDGPALREVVERADGLAAGLTPGKVHCDMSTIDPATTRALADFYAARGVRFLHAPVLGNWRAAREGRLLIFAGGSEPAIEQCQPVFDALGKRVWRWSRPEQATCVKLACNLLLGGLMELLAESLLLAARAGVAPRILLEIFSESALQSPMVQSKGETIARKSFLPPSFYLRHMRKDLDLALAAARELGAHTPVTRAVRDTFAAAEHKRAELDYSSVFEWLEEQSAAGAS